MSNSDAGRRVAIVLAQCARSRDRFGIRFEQVERGGWRGDWAFAVKPAVAKREGYDATRIDGRIALESAYPGCPYCRAPSIWKCGSCDKVSCWDGVSQTVTCASCHAVATISGSIDTLQGGGDL